MAIMGLEILFYMLLGFSVYLLMVPWVVAFNACYVLVKAYDVLPKNN